MRQSSRPCKIDWIAIRRSCGYVDKPWNTPYGMLKAWTGSTHFLTRTLSRVGTEMSVNLLAFDLKRVMNILGIKPHSTDAYKAATNKLTSAIRQIRY